MLTALGILNMEGATQEQKDALQQASINKAEEEMKVTGKTQEQMFGKYAERDAKGNIIPETISKNSIYGQKNINQVLLQKGKKTPAAEQIAQTTKETITATPTGASSLGATKSNPELASEKQIAALAGARQTPADVAAQIFTKMSDKLTEFLNNIGAKIDAFLKDPWASLKTDFTNAVEDKGPSVIDKASSVGLNLPGLQVPSAVVKGIINYQRNKENLGPSGGTEPNNGPGGTQTPSEDKLTGAGPVTASVNNTNSFNFNINGGGAVGDDGKVMALTAAIGQLQEELRVYKAENGDRQPPSTLAMRA
jgi:hypothetical protein